MKPSNSFKRLLSQTGLAAMTVSGALFAQQAYAAALPDITTASTTAQTIANAGDTLSVITAGSLNVSGNSAITIEKSNSDAKSTVTLNTNDATTAFIKGTVSGIVVQSDSDSAVLNLTKFVLLQGDSGPALDIAGSTTAVTIGVPGTAIAELASLNNGAVVKVSGKDTTISSAGLVTVAGAQTGFELGGVVTKSLEILDKGVLNVTGTGTAIKLLDGGSITDGIKLSGDAEITAAGKKAIDLSEATTGEQTITLAGTSRIAGSVSFGNGTGTLNLGATGATTQMVGAISGGTSTKDTINVSKDWTTVSGGTIVGMEVINITDAAIVTIGETVTGAQTITNSGTGALTINKSLTNEDAAQTITTAGSAGALSIGNGAKIGTNAHIVHQANSVLTINDATVTSTSGTTIDMTGATRSAPQVHLLTKATIDAGDAANTAIQMANAGTGDTLTFQTTASTIIGAIKGSTDKTQTDTIKVDTITQATGGAISEIDAIVLAGDGTFDLQHALTGSSTATGGTTVSGTGIFKVSEGSSFTADRVVTFDSSTLTLALEENYTTTAKANLKTITLAADKTFTLAHDLTLGTTALNITGNTLRVVGTPKVLTGKGITFGPDSTLTVDTGAWLDQSAITGATTDAPSIVNATLDLALPLKQERVLIKYGTGLTVNNTGRLAGSKSYYGYDQIVKEGTDQTAQGWGNHDDNIVILLTPKTGVRLAAASGTTESIGTALDAFTTPDEGQNGTLSGALLELKNAAMTAPGENTVEQAANASAVMEQLKPAMIKNSAMQEISRQGMITSTRLLTARLSESGGLLASKSGVSSGDGNGGGVPPYEAWGRIFGSKADQSTRNGVSGYKAKSTGGLVGIDTHLDADTIIGVAFTYARTDVDSKDNLSTQDINTYQGTIYGRYMQDAWYMDGMLGVGANDYSTKRMQPASPSAPMAKATFNGMQYMMVAQGGYHLYNGQAAALTPTAGLRFAALNVDTYTENGAGTSNQTVNADKVNTLDFMIGVSAEGNTMLNGAKVYPELHLNYMYDAIGDRMHSTSSFAGQMVAFTTKGAKSARSTYNAGVKSTFEIDCNTDFIVGYDFIGKEKYKEHLGMIEVRMTF